MTTNNAILICFEGSAVTHRFCPEAEARAFLTIAAERMNSGSMFILEGPYDAECIYGLSPELRNHVAAAKAAAELQGRLTLALDRHGVPRNRDLRIAIFRAFDELTSADNTEVTLNDSVGPRGQVSLNHSRKEH
jgi:hypothetical protein